MTAEERSRSILPHRGLLRDRWDILLVIAAGGAVGSAARWALTEVVPEATGLPPWAATSFENVSGGLVLGALMVFVLDVWPPSRYLRPFVGVGLLGGYTTFSTYMLDTWELVTTGRSLLALAYLVGTLFIGLLAVWLGILAARGAVAVGERRRRQREARFREKTEGDQPREDPHADPEARSRR